MRRCDEYALAIPGLEDVTFCRKGGARIVCELVADLRTALAEKAVECERLKEVEGANILNRNAVEHQKRALAESQAREAKLRYELHEFHDHFLDREQHECDGIPGGCPVLAALALKADNTALVEVCERVAMHAFSWCEANGINILGFKIDVRELVARVLGETK